MAYRCPKCGSTTGFRRHGKTGLACGKCGTEAVWMSEKSNAGGGGSSGGGSGGLGKLSKALTITQIILFIVFLVAIEITVFNFKNFFITCFGLEISGFWIGFLTFIVGLFITFLIMTLGTVARIIIVVLLFFFSILIPGLIHPYCSAGLGSVGGIGEYWNYMICTFKNMNNPENCVVSNTTPTPPPPPPVYDFKPIEIRFGSRYTPTPFTPPTLYANDPYGYSLIITVTNPNTEDALAVNGFYIRSYFAEPGENNNSDMIGSNYRKIMCGKADMCNETDPCSLSPGSDTEISLNFDDTANCTSASNLTTSISEDACKNKNLAICNETMENNRIVGCSKQPESCLKELCKERCVKAYPYLNFAGFDNKTNTKCVCIRNVNNVSELCYDSVFGSQVYIKFFAAHNFSVIGSGEFRVAETEQYLNFEPMRSTSGGPLVVTVFFEPHAVLSNKIKDIMMYINLKNDGDGGIDFNYINMTQIKDKIGFTDDSITKCIKDTTDRVKYLASDDSQEPSCKLTLEPGKTIETHSSIRMDIEINYTYSWLNSKSLPITKTWFDPTKPEEQSYIGMPGYCPRS